jgi:MFS family permease
MEADIALNGAHDRKILIACSFLRAVSTGMIAVVIGLYLVLLKYSTEQIGVVVSSGLLGATVAVLAVTLRGNRNNARRTLFCLSLLTAVSGAFLTVTTNFIALTAVAFIGMLNGMGRDRGASLVIEQAALPNTTTDSSRTMAFAWYNVAQDVGHAVGALLAALPTILSHFTGSDSLSSFRLTIYVYSALMLLCSLLYLRLSPGIEGPALPHERVSPETKRVLFKISALFAMDSLGGGFLTAALISVFFWQRFHVGAEILAALYFAARLANALSHFAAAWLAKRIGLVNTMVFTHAPSSLLLLTVAIAPNFPIAAALFLLREGLVEMDVPTRQSYVMAIVSPHERTMASGVTHLVRLGAWAVAPVFAGVLMTFVSPAAPLIVAAVMKLLYDGLLYVSFRKLTPPEENHSA